MKDVKWERFCSESPGPSGDNENDHFGQWDISESSIFQDQSPCARDNSSSSNSLPFHSLSFLLLLPCNLAKLWVLKYNQSSFSSNRETGFGPGYLPPPSPGTWMHCTETGIRYEYTSYICTCKRSAFTLETRYACRKYLRIKEMILWDSLLSTRISSN
jgi:hypothetical protein